MGQLQNQINNTLQQAGFLSGLSKYIKTNEAQAERLERYISSPLSDPREKFKDKIDEYNKKASESSKRTGLSDPRNLKAFDKVKEQEGIQRSSESIRNHLSQKERIEKIKNELKGGKYGREE